MALEHTESQRQSPTCQEPPTDVHTPLLAHRRRFVTCHRVSPPRHAWHAPTCASVCCGARSIRITSQAETPLPAPTHRTPATLPWSYSRITPLISSYSFERNFSIRSIRLTSFFMSSSTDCRSVSPEHHTPHAK